MAEAKKRGATKKGNGLSSPLNDGLENLAPVWSDILIPDVLEKVGIGKQNQIQSSEMLPQGRFPVIDQGQDYIAGYCNDESRVIQKELPLIIFGDHTRCVKYVDFPFVLGADGTKVLKPKASIFDAKFFYYALRNLDIPNRGYNRHFTVLKEKRIPIPPLPEQRSIAAILGQVQKAIEEQEKLLALTAELKRTLLHQLFTQGLRNEPQKQTDIGPIPQSWEVVPLHELFHTQLGKMLSQKAHGGDDPKPYLRNKNVQWGVIDTSDLFDMDFNERERKKFILMPGDLLVCEGGEPGRAAIWHGELEECYYQKALHRLRPKDQRSTNQFLYHWLTYAFRIRNIYGVSGACSTIAHMPEAQLKILPIPVPSRMEQTECCEVLNSVDDRLAFCQRKHATLSGLFRTLLHELMTAKIRVHKLENPV